MTAGLGVAETAGLGVTEMIGCGVAFAVGFCVVVAVGIGVVVSVGMDVAVGMDEGVASDTGVGVAVGRFMELILGWFDSDGPGQVVAVVAEDSSGIDGQTVADGPEPDVEMAGVPAGDEHAVSGRMTTRSARRKGRSKALAMAGRVSA